MNNKWFSSRQIDKLDDQAYIDYLHDKARMIISQDNLSRELRIIQRDNVLKQYSKKELKKELKRRKKRR